MSEVSYVSAMMLVKTCFFLPFFKASGQTSSPVVRVGTGTGTRFDVQMASSVTAEERCSSCVYKDWIMK